MIPPRWDTLYVNDLFGDITILNHQQESLLSVASRYGNEWAVKRLLREGAELNGNLYDPLVEALRGRHDRIAVRLLQCGLDRNNCDRMLETVARRGTTTMLDTFLHNNLDTGITETILVGVTWNLLWANQLIDRLMAIGGPIVITEKFIRIAAQNLSDGSSLLETIFSPNPGVRITSRAVLEIVRICNIRKIKLLIAREPKIEITSHIMEAAIVKEDVMQLLFDNDPRIEITAAIVARRGLLDMVVNRHPTSRSMLGVLSATLSLRIQCCCRVIIWCFAR